MVLSKIGASLLILWGVLNLIGGIVGSSGHPSPWVLPLFVTAGSLIIIAGISVWSKQKWALPFTLIALIGLSMIAVFSASVLRGWSQINMSHHLIRVAISATLFFLAFIGRSKT